MHGFGLHFVLSQHDRANAARLAFSRPLIEPAEHIADPTDMNSIMDKWYHIEGLTQRDKFMIAFFKRYGKTIYTYIDKPKEEAIRKRLREGLKNAL